MLQNLDQNEMVRLSGKTETGGYVIEICPVKTCNFFHQDAQVFGEKLDQLLKTMHLPVSTDIGISGCMYNCAKSFLRDLGAIGKESGWVIIFGGCSAEPQFYGEVIAHDLSEDDAVVLAGKCLEYYAANREEQENAAQFLERIGIEALQEAVLQKPSE